MRFTRSLAAVTLASGIAQAQGIPTAGEVGRALGTYCALQAQAATVAHNARESGATQAEVLARLSEKVDPFFQRAAEAFKETLADAYAHADLSRNTLFFYRASVCYREVSELRRISSIAPFVGGLRQCQADHGTENSAALLRCVRDLVERTPVG